MSEKLKQDHYKIKPKEQPHQSVSLPREKIPGEEQTLNEIVPSYLAGRGAQFNTKNKFLKNQNVKEHAEGIDDWEVVNTGTQYIEQEVKSIVNKVDSPDLNM